MRITAKTDYAVRAMAELADADGLSLTADQVSTSQHISLRFLLGILREPRLARLVTSVRDLSLRTLEYPGPAAALPDVWRAVRSSLRQVLETTTIAHLSSGNLPGPVRDRAREYTDDIRDYGR